LIDTQTGEWRGFASLDALTVFLLKKVDDVTFPETGVFTAPSTSGKVTLLEGDDVLWANGKIAFRNPRDYTTEE
jgi:hypothetical protein